MNIEHHVLISPLACDLPAVAGGCPLTPVMIERLPVTQPAITNLVFRPPLIIGWGDQGQGTLDPHQDNMLDRTGGPAGAVESQRLLKERPCCVEGRRAFEAIALAGNRVDDVDLHDRLLL